MNARKQAITVAKDLLRGSIDPIDGCRQLAELRLELNMSNDSSFLVFAAIDSDTDKWPSTTIQQHYAKNAITKINAEIKEYFKQSKPEIQEACHEIIDKLS